jgi:hypothetical protein
LILEVDGGDGAEDHVGVNAVPVHVRQAQLGDAGAALRLVDDAASVIGVEVHLGAGRGAFLPGPRAPDLAVADPDGIAVAGLDMGRAISVLGHARGPEIGRQHVEVEMIVA